MNSNKNEYFLCNIDLLCKVRARVTRLPKPGNVWHGNPKCSAGELVLLVIFVSLWAPWSHIPPQRSLASLCAYGHTDHHSFKWEKNRSFANTIKSLNTLNSKWKSKNIQAYIIFREQYCLFGSHWSASVLMTEKNSMFEDLASNNCNQKSLNAVSIVFDLGWVCNDVIYFGSGWG